MERASRGPRHVFAPCVGLGPGVPHAHRIARVSAGSADHLSFQTPGRLMCFITPSGFEGFFEDIGALSPQQQQELPRVLEIAKKYELEILPPPGA